jgi:hypothetical protein
MPDSRLPTGEFKEEKFNGRPRNNITGLNIEVYGTAKESIRSHWHPVIFSSLDEPLARGG